MRKLSALLLATILGLAGWLGAAHADMTHDEALEAVRSGRIKPILPIIEDAERSYAGQVVEVELRDDKGDGDVLYYQIRVLTGDGELLELLVDAQTGEFVGLGGRGIGQE